MAERLAGARRFSYGGFLTAPRALAALLAAAFMLAGTLHAAAHGDGHDAGCVACHIASIASVKLAPSVAALPAPRLATDGFVPPPPVSAPKEARPVAARSRSPPLRNARSL